VRRSVTLPIDLTDAPTWHGWAEFAIVLSGARDPYMMWKTSGNDAEPGNWGWVGRADSESSATIPVGSFGRTLTSGVRITYQGTEQNRGGRLLQFGYSRENSFLDSIGALRLWGDLYANQQYSCDEKRVGPSDMKFLVGGDVTFTEVKAQDADFLKAGMPGTVDARRMQEGQVSIARFLYVGPKTSCLFSLQVSSVMEYFHITHQPFAKAVTSHANGEDIQRATRNWLGEVQSNHSDASKPGMLTRLMNGVATAVHGVQGVSAALAAAGGSTASYAPATLTLLA